MRREVPPRPYRTECPRPAIAVLRNPCGITHSAQRTELAFVCDNVLGFLSERLRQRFGPRRSFLKSLRLLRPFLFSSSRPLRSLSFLSILSLSLSLCRSFFDSSVSLLTLSECAVLSSIVSLIGTSDVAAARLRGRCRSGLAKRTIEWPTQWPPPHSGTVTAADYPSRGA